MGDCGEHCPFLNQADARCAGHSSLDDLEHAYRFCFDRYQACPVYFDLLVECRGGFQTRPPDVGAGWVTDLPLQTQNSELPNAGRPTVQVTISAPHATRRAGDSPVPAVPGL